MRRIAVSGDLVTHTRPKLECTAVTQFGIEFSLEEIKDMSEIAPVIRQIASGVFDQAHAQIADRERAPDGSSVSPGWTIGGMPDQSVTVNASAGMIMRSLPC